MKSPELPQLSRMGSSNLAFALLFLPSDRRSAAMAFYRFCRAMDDIADDPSLEANEKIRRLSAWSDAVESGLPSELEAIVSQYGIDRRLLLEIISGCASDVFPQRFASILELERYCWRVACAVGLVSIKIFGCRDSQSEEFAMHLGHALQMVNILRDIGEDARMGRIYLPIEDLARFGVQEQDILDLRSGHAFLALLRHEASRARARFAAAIPPDRDFHSLRPARIMRAVYQKILDRMEREGFPVFEKRIGLGLHEKFMAVSSVLLGRE